ncbi:Deoxynucleoside kinase [compost metagenome]
MRGRDYESSIPAEYLAQLNGLYDEWISDWTMSPTITLPADELDFVKSSLDFCSIYDLVQKSLQGPPARQAAAAGAGFGLTAG